MGTLNFETQRMNFMVAVAGWPIPSEDIFECYFIEDIFSLSIAGRLKFNDRVGIIERLQGITGQFNIVISYGALKASDDSKILNKPEWDEENHVNMIFYAQQISAFESNKLSNSKSYDILFCDISYFKFNSLNFSYSWPEKTTPSVIVKDFLTKLTKISKEDEQPPRRKPYSDETAQEINYGMSIEETKNQLECFYSPYWNFRQCIQYLLPRSKSSEHNVSGFLAFCRHNNGAAGTGLDYVEFVYSSLENLLKVESVAIENCFDFYPGGKGSPISETPGTAGVLDWHILSYNNFSYKHLLGATYYGYDPSKGKKPFKLTYNYTKAIEKTTILGEYTLFPEFKPEEKFENLEGEDTDPNRPVIWTLETDEEVIENLFYDDWIKRYCQQQMLEVVTLGHPNRKIGDLAELYINKRFDANTTEEINSTITKFGEGSLNNPVLQQLNPKWAGKALIKSITHYFVPSNCGYLQKIVFIKNGFHNFTDNVPFLKATKSNTNLLFEVSGNTNPTTASNPTPQKDPVKSEEPKSNQPDNQQSNKSGEVPKQENPTGP